MYSGYQSRETALQEVSEVQLGERVRFSGSTIHRSFEWDPLAIAQTDPIQDPDTAVTELRRTTRACIHAWAACYPDIIHSLSGGLDSSIVLSCLKSAPSRPNVTCLHYFGTGPDEDERKYARLMAGHVGAELIEHQLDVQEAKLEQIFQLRRSPRPWFYMYELEHSRFEGQLAAERGVKGAVLGLRRRWRVLPGACRARRDRLSVRSRSGPGSVAGGCGCGSRVAQVDLAAARECRPHAPDCHASSSTARCRETPNRTIVSQDLVNAGRRNPKLIHPVVRESFASRRSARGVVACDDG